MTVLLVRPNRNEPDRDALEAEGFSVVVDPYLTISRVENPEGAKRLVETLEAGNPVWLVVTSLNAWENWVAQCEPGRIEEAITSHPHLRCGAIGETTASVLRSLGQLEVTIPSRRDGESLAQLIAQTPPCPVVLPSGSISMRSIPETLIPRGFPVIEEVFYHTEPVATTPSSVAAIASGDVTAVVFRSPSSVRAFFGCVPQPPQSLALVCGGETTAREVERLGFFPTAIAADPTPAGIATAVRSARPGEGVS